jgi:hypothetical protein
MGRTRRTRCRHCRELFRADARNCGRQKHWLELRYERLRKRHPVQEHALLASQKAP